jgi:hypothetical protein
MYVLPEILCSVLQKTTSLHFKYCNIHRCAAHSKILFLPPKCTQQLPFGSRFSKSRLVYPPVSGQNLPLPSPLRTVALGSSCLQSPSLLAPFFGKNEKEPKKKAKRTEKESNSVTTAVGRDSEK